MIGRRAATRDGRCSGPLTHSSYTTLRDTTVIIEPGRLERNYWLDLWRYRELFRVLAWRDLSVRYKQTVIGILWAFIRPFLTMIVFTIIFGRIARLPSDGRPRASSTSSWWSVLCGHMLRLSRGRAARPRTYATIETPQKRPTSMLRSRSGR